MAERSKSEVRSSGEVAVVPLLTDVASYLATGLSTDEILSGIAGSLRNGLGLKQCNIWIRTADGASFRAVGPAGDEVPSVEHWERIWGEEGDAIGTHDDPSTPLIRCRLVHAEEFLGLLEAEVEDGVDPGPARDILGLSASVIAPLLGSMELSEDLASEIALRTREIEDQRLFMSKILDSLPHGLYVVDRDYVIQAWNQKREAGTQGVDREHAVGSVVFDVLHRQPRVLLQSEFDAVFETGAMATMDVESGGPDEIRHYRISKIPMRLNDEEVSHVITIGEDVTESKKIREQISQTEKLAAVGQLAAGVMHEINNPLATIGACIEALTIRVPDLPPSVLKWFEEYLGIIESELGRCKSIIDGLLDFSRPRARVKNPADINQIVEDAIFLAKHHQKFKRIKLDVSLQEGLPTVRANAEQLIQAFLALMINAIDAMEGSGMLQVETYLNPARSGGVVVAFQDTGPGIRGEDISKIFEPFYTTKEPGGGTGLGLSICYGIIQQHDGVILVDSSEGRGATFKVVLPVMDEEEETDE